LELECPDHIRLFKPSGLFDETNLCHYCNAYRFPKETSSIYCNNGKVDLPKLKDPPETLKELYGQTSFLKHIRQYNNALALASIGLSEQFMPGFSPTVKVHGKVYHAIGPLLPREGNQPKFAQLYFFDGNEVDSAHARLMYNSNIDFFNIFDLQMMLQDVNPYIKSIKSVLELPNVEDKQLVLSCNNKPSEAHNRNYNLPIANEIAILELTASTEGPDVILHKRDGTLKSISNIHRSYDPLHYILLFPYGEDGYHVDIYQKNSTRKVSPNMYYRYRLMVRKDDFNIITKSQRLTQQYEVDSFLKAEHQRLKWAKHNQGTLRADKYKGLMDAVDNNDLSRAGKRIILPPTLYGSPRWFAEAFQVTTYLFIFLKKI
jgi:hypothetical protein